MRAKATAVGLAAVLALAALSGCGDVEPAADTGSTTEVRKSPPPPPPAPPADTGQESPVTDDGTGLDVKSVAPPDLRDLMPGEAEDAAPESSDSEPAADGAAATP